MANAQERKQTLIEHKVITDVLPGELDLQYDIIVKWPNATLENAGEALDREDTQSEPTVYLHPIVRQRTNSNTTINLTPNSNTKHTAIRAPPKPRPHHDRPSKSRNALSIPKRLPQLTPNPRTS